MRARLVPTFGTLALAAALYACGGGEGTPQLSGPQKADPQLATGRTVYIDHCASCHGKAGKGGAAPFMADGVVARRYDFDTHVRIVTNGRAQMPAFGKTLTSDEIVAVVRFEREVL